MAKQQNKISQQTHNLGIFNSSVLTINSSAEDVIVLGNLTNFEVGTFSANNQANSVCTNATCASININTITNFNQPLSGDAAIVACDNSNSADFKPGAAVEVCPATCNTTLPIELLQFDAYTVSGNVEITWATAAEINNAYFLIERSGDGLAFNTLERIEGAGTYIGLRNYQMVDTDPLVGQAYYRLTQVDFDGTFTYSKVISVFKKPDVFNLRTYPNPVSKNATFYIDFNQKNAGNVIYELYDVLGKIILTQSMYFSQGQNTLFIPTQNLHDTHYFVKIITTDGVSITKKFMVK